MKTQAVNPWKWQDMYGFSQAIDVSGAQRVLFCAGQTATDGDGHPVHAGDFPAQLGQALDNLETVLKAAGLSLANVVRLTYYTTDIAKFMDAAPALVGRLDQAGCKPASTLLGVTALFHPDVMIEIEATAVV
ncbi:MAG: RidA family protein [Gammaproteobacteria bacterium]|nr:RidA family protein [Gammaproteobacteria bacterium]